MGYSQKSAYLFENIGSSEDVLDQIEEGIIWVDFSGKIVKSNKSISLKTGYSQEQFLQMDIFDFCSNFSTIRWYALVDKLLNKQKISFKYTIDTKQERVLPFSIKAVLGEQEGKPVVTLIARDLGKVKKETEKIKRVVYEYDKLMYRLSHDLRSPICTLLGLVNLTKNGSSKDQHEYLKLMEKTLQKQSHLMTDIHHLSAVHTTPTEDDEIDFPNLITDIRNKVSNDRQKTNVQWSFNFNLSNSFFNDYYLITNLLTPIIDNAVNFSSINDYKEAKINISVSAKEEGAEIRVSDNGKGIEPDLQEQIFDMFFRGSLHSKGSGLGLYLTQVIADRLQASVKLHSSTEGTTFVIFVPNLTD